MPAIPRRAAGLARPAAAAPVWSGRPHGTAGLRLLLAGSAIVVGIALVGAVALVLSTTPHGAGPPMIQGGLVSASVAEAPSATVQTPQPHDLPLPAVTPTAAASVAPAVSATMASAPAAQPAPQVQTQPQPAQQPAGAAPSSVAPAPSAPASGCTIYSPSAQCQQALVDALPEAQRQVMACLQANGAVWLVAIVDATTPSVVGGIVSACRANPGYMGATSTGQVQPTAAPATATAATTPAAGCAVVNGQASWDAAEGLWWCQNEVDGTEHPCSAAELHTLQSGLPFAAKVQDCLAGAGCRFGTKYSAH